MFCRQCGSEIPNEAKFCTFCGAKTIAPVARQNTDAETESAAVTNNPTGEAQSAAAMNAEDKAAASSNAISDQVTANAVGVDNGDPETQDLNNELEQTIETDVTSEAQPAANVVQTVEANVAASPEPSNLKAAVAQNKKRSRRHIPMIVLVALALALATSVAYAAYRVYTDVWVPYQAEQQELAKHPLKDADGDTITAEVSGDAKNALQIADLMMMDPATIPDFLDEQGLSYFGAESYGSWAVPSFEYLDNIYPGVFNKTKYLGSNSVGLYIGNNIYIASPHALGSNASKTMLKSGTQPTGVAISGLPIKQGISDEEVSTFCETCDLGMPLEKFTTTALAYGNEREDRLTVSTVYAGVATPENSSDKIMWYLAISDNECIFTCINADNAYDGLISSYDLFSQEEWNKADNRKKSLMVAQSVSQEWWGPFEYRLNVLTGKVEAQSMTNESWAEAATSASGYVYTSPFDGSTFSEHDINSEYLVDTFQSETTDL